MFHFLPGKFRKVLAFFLILINTLFWCSFLYVVALLRLILPIPPIRKLLGRLAILIAETWIGVNNFNIGMLYRIEWEVQGLEGIDPNASYLVISNHQSWTDIVVLQKVFYKKIPFLKFFLKQELIWVPLLGLAWWALDYPFMKRYTKQELEKHPEWKGKDLETTRKACRKFAENPVSVMNFVEGTRFTAAKREKSGSPFRRLLKPKAAGIAYTLGAMGEQLNAILDVTIVYPSRSPDLGAFLEGKVPKVSVFVRALPMDENWMGDYFEDEAFRTGFQERLNAIWREKDDRIAAYYSDATQKAG